MPKSKVLLKPSKILKVEDTGVKKIGPILTPANGQGIVFFTTANASGFQIYVSPQQDKLEEYFRLTVNTIEAVLDFKLKDDTEVTTIKSSTDATHLIDQEILTTYWLSFSTTYWESPATSDGKRVKKYIPDLRYGKGYAMEKTTLMSEMLKRIKYLGADPLFTFKTEKYVTVYQDTVVSPLNVEPNVYLSNIPLTVDPSPVAIDSATASMMDIDMGHTLSTMLPEKARTLFDTVKNFELDDIIVNAIRFSLETPNMTLNNIFVQKANDPDGFGEEEVYIRITVGKDSKIGPGVPFVLELWPSQKSSPIHDHGNSYAVIKVLHGQINIDIHNKLIYPESTPESTPALLQTFAATKGQFTWMDKNWFQCHRLKNVTDDFCATIQCYLYGDSDRVHWPGFDFINEQSDDIEIFHPESDMDYAVMLSKILPEYYQYQYPQEVKARTVSMGQRPRKKRKLQDA